jgi:type I restriction enzyme S subunit
MSEGAIRDTLDRLTKAGAARLELHSPGDIAVVFRSGILRRAFPVARGTIPFTVNQDLKVLHPAPNVDAGYAFHVLRGLERHVVGSAVKSGTTVESVDTAVFYQTPVHVPQLADQRAIAEILDTVDEAIGSTEQFVAKLQQMKQGLLHDLLTRGIDENGELRDPELHPEEFRDSELGLIPESWKVMAVGNLLAAVSPAMRSGPFGSALLKSELVGEGVPLLGIDNVHVERLESIYSRFVTPTKFRELSRYRVFPKDVMITIMGTVGRCCVVPDDIGDALSSKHVWTLTFDQSRYSPLLACLQFNYAPWAIGHFRRDEQGGIMSAIRSDTLRTALLPVPPRDEAAVIEQVCSISSRRVLDEERLLEKLRLLRTGLQDDLLTGRVHATKLAGGNAA